MKPTTGYASGNTGVHPIRTVGRAALRVAFFVSGFDIARRVFSRGRIGFLVTGARIHLFAHCVDTLRLQFVSRRWWVGQRRHGATNFPGFPAR